jgi:hypothetical protein
MENYMEPDRFSMMLTSLASQTIKEIAVRYKIPELEAARLFYKSEVYKMLENEKTKFWHFSYMSLCMMYDEEKEKGDFAIPEET